jgi:SNF family Na+-dependent transporter
VDESQQERYNRQMLELLNELRVALPGVQILFAFLLTVPFNARFAGVSDFQRDVYFATLLFATVASAFLIAPAIYHRLLFRRHHKRDVIMTGHRCLIFGTAALALAMTGAILLISDFLFSRTTAIVFAGICALMFAYLWFAMGLIKRAGESDHEPEPEEDEWPP